MGNVTATPQVLKQVNLTLIRKVLIAKRTATRAEIALATKISSTTVRSMLAEMMKNEEIESIGHDQSSGGRKAERYRFRPNRYYGIAFCMTDHKLHALLVNLCEEIEEITELAFSDEPANESQAQPYQQVICSFLDEQIAKKDIKAIGLGLPGIVEGGGYWKKQPHSDELYKDTIGDALAARYGIPVVLENDMNATTIGFGRCYAKQFPQENPEKMNIAYLHFDAQCVSAGLLVGGRIVRGNNHFAGELGQIPVEKNRLLDEVMSAPMDDSHHCMWVIRIISWICGILNPQYVALAGPALRRNCIASINDGLYALLPKNMLAEILYAPDVWHDYHDGMAHLSVGKMFDDVQFIKE